MLNQLTESNQALITRVESIEQKQSSDKCHTHQILGSSMPNQRAIDLAATDILTGARVFESQPRMPATLEEGGGAE